MNGVRRFLGGGSSSSQSSPQETQPLTYVQPTGPSWPPATADPTPYATSPPSATARLQPINGSPLNPSRSRLPPMSPARSNTVSSSSSSRKSVSTPASAGLPRRNSVGQLNTRDELLMSLMASEAVIDCREFDILSAEEVEELKKEDQILSSRVGVLTKKLATETRIRDAALSLSKVSRHTSGTQGSSSNNAGTSSSQLDTANERVDKAQKELWKISERYAQVHKRLMEHRAGVLSFSVRDMEKKMSGSNGSGAASSASTVSSSEDSGYNSSNRSTLNMGLGSPTSSSTTTLSSVKSPRFDGAHLFAGHADAIIPRPKLSQEAAAAQIELLEEKLREAKEALAAAGQKQAEMTRELSILRLEKQEAETVLGMDLQTAKETIASFEEEIPHWEALEEEVKGLREDKAIWEEDRQLLEDKSREVEVLQVKVQDLEAKSGSAAGNVEKLVADIRTDAATQLQQKDEEIMAMQRSWQAEREEWDAQKSAMEDERLDDLAHLQAEMERQQQENESTLEKTREELDMGLVTLRAFIKTHGIVLFSRDSSLQGLLNAVGVHIETVHTKLESYAKAEAEWETMKRKLEDDIRAGFDKREVLSQELEQVRRERETLRRENMDNEVRSIHSQSHSRAPSIARSFYQGEESGGEALDLEGAGPEVQRIVALLQPLWSILPSPEARASRFGSARTFRTGSPAPVTPSTAGGPNANVATSLSDLDVRSLKALYDSRQNIPGSPRPGNGPFSIEAFAQRVQALINDDKALIERLIRFAQAHDMLKKNAERAQKLAQDGTAALETYQKQVRLLEDKNMSLTSRHVAAQEELQILHETIERLNGELRDVEKRAIEQAQECIELKEANKSLSAKTLKLAEEAAQAPEMVRKQLEAQLKDTRKQLREAQDEADALRSMEQTQRVALMDELNSMQTENENLRTQLRAVKK